MKTRGRYPRRQLAITEQSVWISQWAVLVMEADNRTWAAQRPRRSTIRPTCNKVTMSLTRYPIMFTPIAISVARRSFTRTNPVVCRNLVSSVLLTRTWENESVAELKRQAKIRGLSPYDFFLYIPSGLSSVVKKRQQGHPDSEHPTA